MKPKKTQFNLEITPKLVLSKIGEVHQLVVPDGYIFVTASTDLNVSYALSTTEKLGKRLKATGVKIDGWGIDAGGRNWDAVCQFSKHSL